jgi:hypothetical protein
MRRISLPLLAVIALGAGCGGGGGGKPLSADEFAKQANAICKAGDVKLAEEGKPLAADPKTTPDQLAQFYLHNAVPNARNKLTEIAKLHPPDNDKSKVKKMLAAGKKATDTVENGLKKQGASFLTIKGPDPFKDFNSMAKDLKLTDCAGPT